MDREELHSLPEEFPPPAAEFPLPTPGVTPPPEEFPPPGPPVDPTPGKRRRRLLFYLAAAAALLLLAGRLRTPPGAPVPEPPVSPAPAATSEPSPAPTATPTPAPSREPAPTPAPTPEPTPEPEPGVEILYYNFSSSCYVRLLFTRPEAFSSVELRFTEPILDLPVAALSFGPEDYADGELVLPAYEATELYWEHREEYEEKNAFPEELALHALLVYEKDGAPVTEERDLMPDPEQGWSARYWPKAQEPSEWAFPGCFDFSVYESETPVALVLNEPDKVKAGTLSVSFSIDGREIDPSTVSYETWNAPYTIGDMVVSPPFYHARLLFPKPDWAPESGVLHVTVVQYLEHARRVVVLEQLLDYSEEPTDQS